MLLISLLISPLLPLGHLDDVLPLGGEHLAVFVGVLNVVIQHILTHLSDTLSKEHMTLCELREGEGERGREGKNEWKFSEQGTGRIEEKES